jgi:hypothetical protein
MAISFVSALYRQRHSRQMPISAAYRICHSLYIALRQKRCVPEAAPVTFAQITDKPSKRIRARVGFRISVSSIGWADSAYSGNFEMD